MRNQIPEQNLLVVVLIFSQIKHALSGIGEGLENVDGGAQRNHRADNTLVFKGVNRLIDIVGITVRDARVNYQDLLVGVRRH